ncbi:hypothetical protein DN407_31235 (plasmid) [Bacillus sp. JAS24-2]|uniref:hypothetical protein n=1 Tax=Bacillus sp. JAS24-2 TaxID=2217832 RepID=UPI0011ECCD80|nr:hypothetical protein [Bacillus sp. JAS24-2]QEL82878.1 hypothetical protein DN407_31235 [Bacillus sp. JAS24-2]
MWNYLCEFFKKVKGFISRALIQDGINLMESHLNGLSVEEEQEQDKKEEEYLLIHFHCDKLKLSDLYR